jgi:hypothetical protein
MSLAISTAISPAMSLAVKFSAAILDTILGRLALLFLTGADGDLGVARHAAAQMLAAYHAETADELRLASEIVSFSFHALEALSQATTPGMSLNHVLRLRGSAVSLSRASHKAQRKLDQVQKARRAGQPSEVGTLQPEAARTPAPGSQTTPEKALDLIEITRDTLTAAKSTGQTWTQAYQQRARAKRMTEKLEKSRGKHAARTTAANVVMAQGATSEA